jgi:polysaccharide pyruvyl transferase WcaK-like protein
MKLWESSLSGASALIIGGGQLLMDNHLDFPMKLRDIVRVACSLGVDIHFSACGVGVGRPWSSIGSQLLRNALLEAHTVTLRDKFALSKLQELVPSLSPLVTFDPAIWASEVYGASQGKTNDNLIGLGVIDLRKINVYNPHQGNLSQQDLTDFWLGVVGELHQRGIAFEIFTNGSAYDYAFAAKIAKAVKEKLSIACPLAKRPLRPRDLALGISRYTAVVAFRLHASIIATSYGIPVVGLAWDDKVRSFYEETGREKLCLNIHECDSEDVLATLFLSTHEGINKLMLAQWKNAALQNASIVMKAVGHVGNTII